MWNYSQRKVKERSWLTGGTYQLCLWLQEDPRTLLPSVFQALPPSASREDTWFLEAQYLEKKDHCEKRGNTLDPWSIQVSKQISVDRYYRHPRWFFQTRAGSIPRQEHTYTFRLNSTPRAPALTGARMFAFDPITRVTGEVAPGVHLKPVSTGVSAVMDQRQYSTTHLWSEHGGKKKDQEQIWIISNCLPFSC